MEKKRLTTAKTRIKSITGGRFFKQEGHEPNYVLAPSGQRLSRVRILATAVDKFNSESGKFSAMTLDDGTDTLRAKVFNSLMLDGVQPGDILDVIGRVKEYNGEIYLAPETITKAEPNYEILRELEIREQEQGMRKLRQLAEQYKLQTSDMAELTRILRERLGVDEDTAEALVNVQEPETASVSAKENVLQLIEKLDSGSGSDYAGLLEASKLSEEIMDSVINELLSDGICFEPKPGKIKKL